MMYHFRSGITGFVKQTYFAIQSAARMCCICWESLFLLAIVHPYWCLIVKPRRCQSQFSLVPKRLVSRNNNNWSYAPMRPNKVKPGFSFPIIVSKETNTQAPFATFTLNKHTHTHAQLHKRLPVVVCPTQRWSPTLVESTNSQHLAYIRQVSPHFFACCEFSHFSARWHCFNGMTCVTWCSGFLSLWFDELFDNLIIRLATGLVLPWQHFRLSRTRRAVQTH